MYVNNFIRYIETIRRYSPRTVGTYSNNLTFFVTWCKSSGRDINALQPKDITAYIVYLAEERNLQANSINNHLASIRSYFDYCCRFEGLPNNPAAGVRDLRTPKMLPKFISESKMNFLIDHLLPADTFKRMRTRIVVLIFYHTGIRCQELERLTCSDVNLSRCFLRVIGKGNKERIIPFGEELRRELTRYVSMRPKSDNTFLQSIYGEALTARQIRRICAIALRRIVPENLAHPHVLRHTFATVMMNHGARIENVRLLLGHASIDTTAIYQHVSVSYLQNIHAQAFKR